MRVLILDSGPLINLSMNGLLYILEGLKAHFQGKIIITRQVKYETIDRPLNVPRFELGALSIQALLNSGVVELPSSLNISDHLIDQETGKLMNLANHSIKSKDQWITLVSEAEMSCIAVSNELNRRGIESIIAIDERTTRMLIEDPKALERIMSAKLHTRVKLTENVRKFPRAKFIRSPELIYAAYKKDLLNLKGTKALEAAIFASKYKGSAISFEEVDILKRL